MTQSDSDPSIAASRADASAPSAQDRSGRSGPALWRAGVFPILMVAAVVTGNWALVVSFGDTRSIGSAAAAVVIVPAANLFAAGVGLGLIPFARWSVRPHSVKAQVIASVAAPFLAVFVDLMYIRSLPLGH